MGLDDRRASGPSHEPRFVPAGTDGGSATPVLGATITPWVLDLIRRFRAAGPSMRICTHLAGDPDEPAVWQSSVPDLRSCRRAACTGAVLAALERRLGHPPADEPPRCTTCGRTGLAVRGAGVAVGTTMLRGTVCDDCLAARPVPTATATIDPATDVPRGPEHAPGPVDEPLDVERQELAATEGPVQLHAVGRRALRRGWLLAEACCRATRTGLDADRAVVGGLLVRAAKLARGLADPVPADGAYAYDVAFRSLVETTTTLWWLLRVEGPAFSTATAAFRDPGEAGRGPDDEGPGDLRERLAGLGRETDHATLLGPAPEALPGSWRELTALHLSDGPAGFVLDLDQRDVDPLRLLVAGEHLSLACADYAARMPTDLDPDELRRLADEVTELRADVERASTEPAPGSSEASRTTGRG